MKIFGINGFGRIGRTSFRVWWKYQRDVSDLKVINTSGSMPIKDWVYLMKYDSNYGPFGDEISFEEHQSNEAVTDEDPLLGILTVGSANGASGAGGVSARSASGAAGGAK